MFLKSLEYWVGVQLTLDVGLLILALILILKLRTLGRTLHASHPPGENFAEELTSLSQKLEGLEKRLQSWMSQPPEAMPGFRAPGNHNDLPHRDTGFLPPEIDQGKSLRAQVEGLAQRGWSPEEIARRLGLQLAEVKVALDLSRILPR